MDIPLGNIFEVTINSNRLYSYLNDILGQLKEQSERINGLGSAVSSISSGLQEQLRKKDQSLEIQLQKMRKTNLEEVNYVRLFMRDVDKKAADKFADFQTSVNFLNIRIDKLKETLEDDTAIKLSYFDKRLSSLSSLPQDQERTQQQISQLRETLAETNYRIQKITINLQNENKKNKELSDQIMEKIHQTERQFKFEAEQIYSMKNSMDENTHSRNKRRNKDKKDISETQIFSNIISKIDEVEHSIIRDNENDQSGHHPRRSNVSNSKIVKSNTNINQVSKRDFGAKSAGKFKQFENIVMQKLAKLQALSIQKFGQFQKEISKVANRNQVVDQHIGILARKIDKEKFKITEVAENMKRYDDKKVDQKTIENLKNMIKKMSKETEEILDNKLNKDVYEKEKFKNMQKIQFLNELLIQKAQKTQVKKGLAFLQEKIKEIIIVLAEQRGSAQDGAVKKTPFKCLSCDKDLEVQRSQLLSRMTPKQNPASITRCNTNQLRKRIRMINNTITTNQYDE